jgi:hypothetical protein
VKFENRNLKLCFVRAPNVLEIVPRLPSWQNNCYSSLAGWNHDLSRNIGMPLPWLRGTVDVSSELIQHFHQLERQDQSFACENHDRFRHPTAVRRNCDVDR